MESTNVMNKEDLAYVDHAYTALKIGFVVAPIVAGIDKFFNYLTTWTKYLAPMVTDILGIAPETFMRSAGVVEIIVGVGVLYKPKIFAYVLSAWLLGIMVNLLIQGQFLDVALRDLGLAIGAFALGQLATQHDHAHVGEKRTLMYDRNTDSLVGRA